MVDFPSTLPLPLVSGTHQELPSFKTDNVEDGPSLRERLVDSPPATFNVTWNFSPDDMDAFDTWWRDTVLRGALNFNMGLFVGNAVRTHELQFIAPPRKSLNRRRWTVTAALTATGINYG